MTNVILEDYLYFGLTNNIYFKGVSTNGVNKRLGLNTTSPESTLDIHGNSVGTLNVYTSELVNRNILAHNYDHNGIALYTDNSKSSIQFYNTGTTRQNQVGVLGTESYEIIYNNGKVVGRATGGDFGFRLSKSIALGMVKPDIATTGQKLKIDILGKMYDATVLEESPYDPENKLLRA